MPVEPILFLHGALGSKHQFKALTAELKNRFDCHTLNFSGHGGEFIPPQGLTFATFANDILQYMDSKGLKQVNLFGFSMGGYAALYFAYLHPERVKSIFTLNVKFNWDPITTAKEMGMLDPDKMLDKVPTFANNLMVLHGMHLWKQLLRSTSDMMKSLSETIVMSEEQLRSVSCKVLLGIGDRDQTSSIQETLHVYRMLPQASMWVVPETGHPFERIPLDLLVPVLIHFLGKN